MPNHTRTTLAQWALLMALCASGTRASEPVAFSHDAYDSLLARHVDAAGRVDYEGLARDHIRLDRYLASLAAYGPANHPERFSSRTHVLAYWINAYNAFVLRGILDALPIASVADAEGGLDAFFRGRRFVAGGDSLTLDEIENTIVRPRFRDPRVHFALNCGAVSCPPLDARAYRGADLDEHLDRQARRFARDPRHVRLQGDVLRLSKVMDWYGDDFVNWFPRQRLQNPPESPGLVDYLLLYLPPEQARKLRSAGNLRIEFADYDWTLNRQPSSREAQE